MTCIGEKKLVGSGSYIVLSAAPGLPHSKHRQETWSHLGMAILKWQSLQQTMSGHSKAEEQSGHSWTS